MPAALLHRKTIELAGTTTRGIAAAILMVAFAYGSVSPATAQDSADKDKVVAKVGGLPITGRDLEFAATELSEQFAKVPEEMRKAAVLNALIDIKSLARQADAAKLGEDDEFKARMAFLRDQALHNFFFQQRVLDTVSEEEVKARYDKEVAATEPEPEIRARHILLKTEEEAKAVIAELDQGADFAELAKEKSTGPSGKEGGDLGFFDKGRMVPEFEQAAFALEKGAYTKEPVKTQFGWHVIMKEDERLSQPPAFEQVKDQVRQVVLRESYAKLLEDARKEVEVEIVDEELKAQLEKAGVR